MTAIEALVDVGRRISGTATILQRTQHRWTSDELQQFNRLCEWSREIFDRTRELEEALAAARRSTPHSAHHECCRCPECKTHA